MNRKIHTKSKIFFKDPIVIKVIYDDNEQTPIVVHTKLCRKLYKNVFATYGYTPNTHFAEVNDINKMYVEVAYFCFQDEQDALQFMLSNHGITQRLKLWPKVEFTIHEIS